jgi:hypothetical protein
MSGSSALAQAPIDTYAMYRAAGQTITGGDNEVRIHAGEHNYPGTYFGDTGSVVPDPADAVGAWLGGPATTPTPYGIAITRLRGGQTAPPTGSFYLWLNNGWVNGPYDEATFLPDPSSPIQRVRWSAVADVETTAGGPHLVYGHDSDSVTTWGVDTGEPAIGVQPDPTHVQLYVQWQTQDGTWSIPVLETYQVDAVRPVLSWSPRISFTSGTAGTTAPARITWSATDDASGILKFLLQKQWSKPGGPLSTTLQYLPATTTYANFSATLSDHYTFQVMAFDRAGNNDDVEFLPSSTFAAIQSGTALHYYKTWSTASSSNYLGGSTRYQSSLGAYVSYTFTGQAIAFVSTKGPTRGKFEVYIDGVKKATVDLYAAGTHYRQVVYQTSWASPGTHTIKIRVLGTSGRPRVDFDGFLRAT